MDIGSSDDVSAASLLESFHLLQVIAQTLLPPAQLSGEGVKESN
jgi:hypothetical protein